MANTASLIYDDFIKFTVTNQSVSFPLKKKGETRI